MLSAKIRSGLVNLNNRPGTIIETRVVVAHDDVLKLDMQIMIYGTTQLRLISKTVLTLWAFLSTSAASYACGSMCMTMAANQQFVTHQTHIYKSMNDASMKRRRDGNDSDSPSPGGSRTQASSNAPQDAPSGFVKSRSRASANNNPLPYNRDPALSAKLREEFLAGFMQQIPGEAADMRSIAQQTDLIQIMAGFIQLQGLDSGSMENLIAFWYGQGWAIAHQKPLPTAQQYQAIAAQVRKHFEKSPVFKNMDNASRQTFFEQHAYPLFVLKANYTAYLKQGKTELLSRMAATTREGFSKMGLDLQNLQLTSRGLVPL
jgi:hypothetical protein